MPYLTVFKLKLPPERPDSDENRLFNEALTRLSKVNITLEGLDGWSDHQEIGASVVVTDLKNGKDFTVRISNHNIWCPGTPISLKTLESLGILIPAFSAEIKADLKLVGALYAGWVEADIEASLRRMAISGERHAKHVAEGMYDIQVLQEVPLPNSRAFDEFTASLNDSQKQTMQTSFVNSDNNGKYGKSILVSPQKDIHITVCSDIETYRQAVGEPSLETLSKIERLFVALDATKYDKTPHERRAALYIIAAPEGTYGIVAMHTDWAKVNASVAVLSAAHDLGMAAMGDLNIQTLADSGYTQDNFTVKQAELLQLTQESAPDRAKISKLQVDIDRMASLFEAESALRRLGIAIPSGNTYDGIFGNGVTLCFEREPVVCYSLAAAATPKLVHYTFAPVVSSQSIFSEASGARDPGATPRLS